VGSSETPAVASIENASGRSRKLRMVETRDSRSVSTPHFQGNEPTFVARFPEHLTRAPAHQRNRHLGRERPRWPPRGCLCEAHAGSLTPLPCCYPCAGALTGRHKPPPAPTAAPAPTSKLPRSCHGSHLAWLTWAGHVGIMSASGRGANRALEQRPPSRPPSAATTRTD
jgi:hypothetical protein